MHVPTILDMLKAGVHFGHITSKRHPKMAPFIFGVRSNVHIIDLESTTKHLENVLTFIQEIVKSNGTILFVSTKKQAQKIVRDAAEACGMPYMVDRWIGGLLTNFGEIHKVIKRYNVLMNDIETGKLKSLTKKERIRIERERVKLNGMIGGIKEVNRLPQALYIVDIQKENTAITEAQKMNIPIIAMTDTNVNPERVSYPIPANDDATRSITLITHLISDAINESKEKYKIIEEAEEKEKEKEKEKKNSSKVNEKKKD